MSHTLLFIWYNPLHVSVRSEPSSGIYSGVPRGGGFNTPPTPPPPEIPKAIQNRAKLNPIVKTIKNCWI